MQGFLTDSREGPHITFVLTTISLLDTIGMLVEKTLLTRILIELSRHALLYDKQSRF